MNQADQDYIKAIQENDREGLKQLYEQFLPRISSLIRNNGGSSEDAKDVFQDALLVLFKKTKQPGFKLTSGFYTLLYGICRNLWGNRLQKKSSSEVSLPEDYKYKAEPGLDPLIAKQEEDQLFWDAFRQLGQDCQQLMQLFFAKVKMAEIAERMQYGSVGYAKKRKYQCKEQLVKLVKADARFAELATKV